jgi:hypothetical protein
VLLWLNPTGCLTGLGPDWTCSTNLPASTPVSCPTKGSINQAIALRRRRADVERLYASGPGVELLG